MEVVSLDSAEHYKWGDRDACDGWHLLKSNALSIILEKVPSGCSEVRHYHEQAEQFFFVLSGVATLEVEGVIFQVSANHGLHIPAGSAHQLSNKTGEELRFVVTSTPPSHGDRVEL